MKSLALVFAVQGGLEALPGMAALGMSFGDNPAGQFAHRLTMWSDYIRAIRSASSKPSKP